MGIEVETPDGMVEFPDGMEQSQIQAVLRKKYPPQAKPTEWLPMAANSVNKAVLGMGDAVLNTPNRLGNLGRAAVGAGQVAMGHPELAPALQPDPNYLRTLSDKVGTTNTAFDPTTTPQRYADAAIQAGTTGLLSPADSGRQLATNVLTNAAGGVSANAAGEAGGGPAAQLLAALTTQQGLSKGIDWAGDKVAANALRKSQNAVRDQTIKDAQEAGYVLSPAETNPGVINNALEGIAGKTSVRQLASQRNQEVTNQLAREDIGASESSPITGDLTKQIRKEAYDSGYKPVEDFGLIRPGKNYRKALSEISSKYTGAANSFPSAVSDEVGKMVDSLNVKSFNSADAVKMAQILRENASKSYASGDAALGKAQRAAANAIEDQIEASISVAGGNGTKLVEDFRDARKLMAKTHTVDSALNEGSSNVKAQKLAAALRAGKPLSGGLEVAGKTAETFPKDMQSPETMGAVPGFSPLDVAGAVTGATVGSMAAGNPAGAAVGLYPLARPAARSLLLSKPYQKLMGTPSYKNSMIAKLLSQGDVKNPQANSAALAALLSQQEQK